VKKNAKAKEVVKMVSNLPIKKFRAANIEAAIWSNKRKRDDGEEIEFKTLSLSRSYKKRDEDIWRNEIINLRKGDISKILVVLQEAQKYLLLRDEGKKEE